MSERETEKISQNLKAENSKKKEVKITEEKTETVTEQPQEEQTTDLQKQSENLQIKYNELNDKYLRLFSDFDNFRKRSIKERIELIKFAGEDVIVKLLPVLDDFERALQHNKKSEENKSMTEGIQLIYQKMKNILFQEGLKEMEIKEGEFNPDLHDAITKIPAPEKNLQGKIIEVIEKGYYLNDKVIRHAKVVVGE